jgi:hypothetical protein
MTSAGILTCVRAADLGEAVALARSAALNSPSLGRAIVLEGNVSERDRNRLQACFDHIIPLRAEHFRMGWQIKNVVHEYSPFERTLFLDADCLVMRDLEPAFAAFRGKPICFSAKPVPAQETGASLFAKVSLQGLLKHFGADWWPQILGGGHFYFEKGEATEKLFRRARYWANLELLRPFGWEQTNVSDELTLQFALVEAGLARECTDRELPLMLWTPSVSADPDVFQATVNGRRTDGTSFTTSEYYAVHFGGDHHNAIYRRERYRLALQSSLPNNGASLPSTFIRSINRRALLGPIAFVALKAERLPGKLARIVKKMTDFGDGPSGAGAQADSGSLPTPR